MKMKHLVIVVMFSLPSFWLAGAETKVGLRAGVNFATFSNSSYYYGDPAALSTYLGPVIGGMLQVDVAGPLWVRLEPRYLQKGAKTRFTWYREEITKDFKLDFIEVPLLLGFEITSSSIRPYIFAGPNLGFMLTDGYKKTDAAVDVGLGIAFETSRNVTLLVDVRYSTGLTDLDTEDLSIETRGIQPILGVSFGL